MNDQDMRILNGLRVEDSNMCELVLDNIPGLRNTVIEWLKRKDPTDIPIGLKRRILELGERPSTPFQQLIAISWYNDLLALPNNSPDQMLIKWYPEKRLEVGTSMMESNEGCLNSAIKWHDVMFLAEWCPTLRERVAKLVAEKLYSHRSIDHHHRLKCLMWSSNPETRSALLRRCIRKLTPVQLADYETRASHELALLWAKVWADAELLEAWPDLYPQGTMDNSAMYHFISKELWLGCASLNVRSLTFDFTR